RPAVRQSAPVRYRPAPPRRSSPASFRSRAVPRAGSCRPPPRHAHEVVSGRSIGSHDAFLLEAQGGDPAPAPGIVDVHAGLDAMETEIAFGLREPAGDLAMDGKRMASQARGAQAPGLAHA